MSDREGRSLAPTLAYGCRPDCCFSNLTSLSGGPRWVMVTTAGLEMHPFRCD